MDGCLLVHDLAPVSSSSTPHNFGRHCSQANRRYLLRWGPDPPQNQSGAKVFSALAYRYQTPGAALDLDVWMISAEHYRTFISPFLVTAPLLLYDFHGSPWRN